MTAAQAPRFEPIAVIGLGCVLPDAPDVATFWQNLVAGRSSIREVPKSRWDSDVYWTQDRMDRERTYSKIGSFVQGFDLDWRRFRVPPKMVAHVDPSQQWAIEAAGQALRDAGYDRKPFDRGRVAVVFGNAGGGEIRVENSLRVYAGRVAASLRVQPGFQRLPPQERAELERGLLEEFKRGLPELNEDTLPGELSNVISGRIASIFNLTGKNFTVDAACASTLAAVDVACQALQTRQCDLALTGGSDRMQEPGLYVKFCRLGALSATGSRPFDASADGFVMGEGCGALLLKRLEDAHRDGDRVYAVIEGIGSSSDGGGKSLVAPKASGQTAAIRAALSAAQVAPDGIDLLECHGTGTVVGDATEISSLREVFGGVNHGRRIAMGSVKSNLGHLKSAAGVAALLKVILALHHETLPPTIGVEKQNPALDGSDHPLVLQRQPAPWLAPPGRPRRAGVSGFGFGGTNFHLILADAPSRPPPADLGQEARSLLRAVRPHLPSDPAEELGLLPEERMRLVALLRERAGLPRDRPIPLNVMDSQAALIEHLRATREGRA